MSSTILQAANTALAATGSIKLDLQISDVLAMGGDTARRDTLNRARSWTYVWLGAILESFIRDVLAAAASEINVASVQFVDLRRSLYSLVAATRFDSLQKIRGLEMWKARADLMELPDSPGIASGINARPMDGRTIEAAHLILMWHVFGFPGAPFPGPVHKMYLLDLKENRNRLAHGEMSPLAMSKLKTATDLIRLVDHVEDIVIHINQAIDSYMKAKMYLR
jgi:hypothetical protein